MARLYTNENFPFPAAAALRQRGHDVVTSHDAGQSNQAIADADVLSFATASERAVVTLNRRHFVRLHAERPRHAGIIVCTFDPDFDALASRVHEAIKDADSLIEHLVRVNRPPTPAQ